LDLELIIHSFIHSFATLEFVTFYDYKMIYKTLQNKNTFYKWKIWCNLLYKATRV